MGLHKPSTDVLFARKVLIHCLLWKLTYLTYMHKKKKILTLVNIVDSKLRASVLTHHIKSYILQRVSLSVECQDVQSVPVLSHKSSGMSEIAITISSLMDLMVKKSIESCQVGQ